MSWLVVGVGGGSALLGAYTSHQQAKQQAKQNQANMMAQAAQDRYSPWTGAAVQTGGANAPNIGAQTLAGGLGAGMTGAMMAGQFKKMNFQNPNQAGGTPQNMMVAGGAGDNMGTWSQMPTRATLYGESPYTMMG